MHENDEMLKIKLRKKTQIIQISPSSPNPKKKMIQNNHTLNTSDQSL